MLRRRDLRKRSHRQQQQRMQVRTELCTSASTEDHQLDGWEQELCTSRRPFETKVVSPLRLLCLFKHDYLPSYAFYIVIILSFRERASEKTLSIMSDPVK